MRLTRVAVSSLRRFGAPFALEGLEPGLNIFSGPNEAGKSSLVRAIRAAAFERHRSSTVEDLRPFGDASASPSVALDFEFGGRRYRLHKRFLQHKSCELQIDGDRLEGVAAEDALAELLGFRFAAKGASRAEHWGIPGLLWIEQGAGHELAEVAGHAADHLRRALEASVSEVVSTGGDAVAAEVRRRRDAWLTDRGAPRGAHLEALDARASRQAACDALREQVAAYRAQVDALRDERTQHAHEARERPWAALQDAADRLARQLQALEGLQGERDRQRLAVAQWQGTAELLAGRIAAQAAQADQARARADAVQAAEAALQRETDAVQDAERAHRLAVQALHRVRSQRDAVRRRADARRLVAQAEAAALRVRAAEERLVQVAQQQREVDALQAQALAARVPVEALRRLRQVDAALREAQIRRSAVATRLHFQWQPGVAARLDGAALESTGERLLVAPATLELPGVGRLVVEPGGEDLPALAERCATLSTDHAQALRQLDVPDLASAEARARRSEQLDAALAAAQTLAQRMAPAGGAEALRRELAEAQAGLMAAQTAIARLSADGESRAGPEDEAEVDTEVATETPGGSPASPPSLDGVPDLPDRSDLSELSEAQAEAAHAAAESAAEAASRRLGQVREGLATARSRRDSAVQERAAIDRLIADPDWALSLAQARQRLAETTVQREAAERALAAIDERLAAARPAQLQLEQERHARSAAAQLQDHLERERRILRLEALLAAAGADGLEEALAEAEAERARAERRAEEIAHEAAALDFLHQRLQARRQALTGRLQAPLQGRIAHYLAQLFPGARLTLDEALVPQSLRRTPGSGSGPDELAPYASLSHGAREQMGLVCRLAYADLLADAGRPTLLILDDALVHSDGDRLQGMKQVLYDAAQRHQVLVFTCHPGRWQDLGVRVRPLAAQAG